MEKIDYDGRLFRAIDNSASGEVSSRTLFTYHHRDHVVWATYEGGHIMFGTIVALVNSDQSLAMRYSHINKNGQLMTGKCHSTPEVLPDGRIRLHEKWEWTSGRTGKGTSVLEEIEE